jgi:putative ABC transport system permease protein
MLVEFRESLRQDVRFGLRTLWSRPAFTATVVAALALGIGPSALLFGLADAVLWSPLPFPDPAGLLAVGEQRAREGRHIGLAAPADFFDWRDMARSFSQLSAYESPQLNLTGDGEPERVQALAVSTGFLQALRVAPALGRAFRRDEEGAAHRVTVLSDGLWRRRYGAAPDIVGRAVRLDGVAYDVVGVLPPVFWWPSRPELLVPLALTDEQRQFRALHFLEVVGRLAPGASLASARAELALVGSDLERRHPDTNTGHGAAAIPLHERFAGAARPALALLLGAAALVLAIACSNATILLLARAGARRNEMAVCMAIGAGRLRLARQLVVETLLLAALGGAIGVLLASFGAEMLRGILPPPLAMLPGLERTGVGLRSLIVALGVTLAAGILTGAATAGAASDERLLARLSHETRSSTGGRSRLRRALVVAELALSLVLLVGTGLMLVSLERVLEVSPGFEARGLVMAPVVLPTSRYGGHAQTVAFYEAVLQRLRGTPGVEGADVVTALPFSGADARLAFQIEGRPGTWPVPVRTHPRLVSASYLRTMRIPLVRGRHFDARDAGSNEDVVILNEAAARRFWPGEDPIGRRISFDFGPPRWLRIVGVVGDVRHGGLEAESNPEAYLPYLQPVFSDQARTMTVVVRGAGSAAALGGAIRAAVAAADPEQPAPNVRSVSALVADSTAPRRLNLGLLLAFAVVALVLTGEGLYGVMAYLVLQRTREIGVRVAFGASPAHVVALVLRQLGSLVVAGIALGIPLALALSRLVASQLFGITPAEPGIYFATAALLAAVALVAVLVPIWRAMHVDPVVALQTVGLP